MTLRVQMLGLMRFSYVGLRGYQVDHQSFEQRRAFLYDTRRLRRRWFWFQNVALPAWLAQSDPDFTLVIMTGPDLPAPYLDRLHDIAVRTPQIKIALVPPMERHLQACRAAIRPHLDGQADVIGHFRHDDDDAVAVDYIERAKTDFEASQRIWHRQEKLCVDHMRGLMIKISDAKVQIVPRMCYNMGVAQTVFLAPDADQTALHFEHWKINQWMPGVSIGEPLMFLRLIHGDSDSGDAGLGFSWEADPEKFPVWLRKRFRVDLGSLHEGARQFA